MKTMNMILVFIVLVTALSISACNLQIGQSTISTPTFTNLPQVELLPVDTTTPIPVAFATLTLTPEPTVIPTIVSPTDILTTTPTEPSSTKKQDSLIAFIGRVDGDNIYFMKSDGTNIYSPFSPMFKVLSPAWSPRGTWFTFEYVTGSEAGLKIFNPNKVVERNIEDLSGLYFNYSWSPDDQQLAYLQWDTCNVEILLPSTNVVRELEAGKLTVNGSLCDYRLMGWDPDSRYLIIADSVMNAKNLIIIDVEMDTVFAQIKTNMDVSVVLSSNAQYLALGLGKGKTPDVQGPAIAIKNFQDGTWQSITIPEAKKLDFYNAIAWLLDGRLLFGAFQASGGPLEASYWYFNPEEDVKPYPATDYLPPIESASISQRLPTNMYLNNFEMVRFSESPDRSQIAVAVIENGKELIYIMDWSTGEINGPIAEGLAPCWQPSGSGIFP